jgi:exopolysaccharide biosynthesis polyprenyl glycosylphosphotransferase
MLRYSDAEGLSAGARTSPNLRLLEGERATIDLTDGAGTDVVLLEEPSREIPQQDRLAVGRTLRLLGHLLDAAALVTPLMISSFGQNAAISMRVVLLFALVGTILLWPTHRRGRLVVGPSEGLVSVIARVGLAPVVTSGLLTLTRLGDLSNAGRFIDVVAIVQILVLTLPLVLLGRLISFRLSGLARRRGYDLEDTLIVGTGPVGVEVAAALQDNPEFGLVPCGFVDRFDDELTLPLVGRPEHLPEILARTGARHVVLAFGAAGEEELVGIIRRCHDTRVQFYAVPRLFELGVSHEDVGHEVDGLPLVPVRRPGTASGMWPAKRAFDVVASSLLLLLTAPVSLACAAAVKLTSPGPVFFRQVRVGIGGRPFEILKFRTMKVNDDSATQWSVDADDRVTAAGRFLRPSHLDELPQLINVVRGERSRVGPRPERPHFVEQFGAEIDGYHYRHRVPVGITGWAQVNGFWGDSSIETRVRLDNRYIENWSLWRDLVIGLRTIPTLLGKRR